MPMTVELDDKALRTLMSPKPSESLRDIALAIGKSKEIGTLATIGRNVLRSCVSARKYQPPIPSNFNYDVDAIVMDHKLAKIAEVTGLLERLNIYGVATDPNDLAQILCAYVGASFVQSFKQRGTGEIHLSISDICEQLLNDDGDDDPTAENDSANKMRNIAGVMQMPQIPPEPSPGPFVPAKAPVPNTFVRDDETVSSGRSPPPNLYGAHYQQPPNSYYHPNSGMPPHSMHMYPQPAPSRFVSYVPGQSPVPGASFAHPQPHYPGTPPMTQPQPPPQAMPRGGYGEYPGMGMPQNPPGYNVPPVIPQPPPPTAVQQSQGFISLFNELAMKNRMSISWQQQKSGQQHIPEWTMWLMVDGQAKGYGTASTKQSAKEIAAKVALQAMGWLNA